MPTQAIHNRALRRLLKFLHTMGAMGLMGAMACLLVLSSVAPPPSSLAQYAMMRGAMGAIATWIFMPSLLATLVAGLLAIGVNSAFHQFWLGLAGWGLGEARHRHPGVRGRPRRHQRPDAGRSRTQRALAGQAASLSDAATLAGSLNAERNVLWVLLAVATANVVLGIWRPRFTRD